MNIITIHTSHDGSITISKNGNLIVHAQIDRFNNIIASSQPSIKLLLSIKELNIKFDLVYFSFLMESCHGFWIELLKKYDLLKNKCKIMYFENKHHHYFHGMCAKATVGNSKHIVVIDGHGSPLNNGYEQETIFKNDKIIFQSQKNIGFNYELKTAEVFNIENRNRSFRSCGKLMALSAYDKKIKIFQKKTETLINDIMPTNNITYTGGVAQNVLANSNFLKRKIKIDPLCTDQGISLGVMNHLLNGKLNLISNPIYLGFKPKYNLNKFKFVNVEDKDVCKILRKEPVGLFQGKSEQGQRGLGNRSLLVDATNKKAVDMVKKIKKREWFRPFAPAVLEEKASEFFEIEGTSPYMLYVFKMKKIITSICSIEKTSRIQTVSRKNNFNFYNLLNCFYKMYNIPLLLNTSLNLSGHTLVEDLDDLYYMMKFSNLKFCYLPEIKKLIMP